ncbi:acyl-CoA desaturase [Allostreptomyces psammosilenae]|uniref:Stearoyl-CoA desaturase (Delta-9 desaturase) n=1 Tax=Allostreptomyces psammosilenae TaxID=1892865 RepID=A0A853A5L8_9ACTN|nr:fatty acid desaturase [Allostreptomyces psammosilenae]NYI05981.1 stearoyl-CoA desaturase (delta-9 desaturase) [Allostreptomyces psammosilenae]
MADPRSTGPATPGAPGTPPTPGTATTTALSAAAGTLGGERKGPVEQVALALFIGVPFVALIAAVPLAWGWGVHWRDLVIALVFYYVSGMGVTIGFHRHFTHSSFKARRPLRVFLAIAGSLAIEGPVIRWVADHRRHHKFSDKEGDPHSPWRYGETVPALAKGLFYAHMAWMFDVDRTPQDKYAPDLLKDRDIVRVSRHFLLWVAVSLLLPAAIGGLWSWSWQGAVTAFFWGGLVRVGLLHHVTWSINSICHAAGERPFRSRDRSGNVWWLAVLSFGESWHNLHHADPTSARHGVLRGQWDSSARVIRWLELLGWAHDVRWPSRERVAARRVTGQAA